MRSVKPQYRCPSLGSTHAHLGRAPCSRRYCSNSAAFRPSGMHPRSTTLIGLAESMRPASRRICTHLPLSGASFCAASVRMIRNCFLLWGANRSSAGQGVAQRFSWLRIPQKLQYANSIFSRRLLSWNPDLAAASSAELWPDHKAGRCNRAGAVFPQNGSPIASKRLRRRSRSSAASRMILFSSSRTSRGAILSSSLATRRMIVLTRSLLTAPTSRPFVRLVPVV
jgi:hypothetical protein